MAIATEVQQSLPTGTWALDPVHSTVGFEIEYMVGTFRGQFREVEGTLAGENGRLEGAARVASIDVKDENLAAHLQSPEFFDAERHPELLFAAGDLDRSGDELSVQGELTLKGVARPVVLTGTITDPVTDPYGRQRIGVKLSATVDRTEFGIDWNAPLPSGEPALANDVTLAADLHFVQAA